MYHNLCILFAFNKCLDVKKNIKRVRESNNHLEQLDFILHCVDQFLVLGLLAFRLYTLHHDESILQRVILCNWALLIKEQKKTSSDHFAQDYCFQAFVWLISSNSYMGHVEDWPKIFTTLYCSKPFHPGESHIFSSF